MKKELQDKLFEKYPNLFKEKDLPMTQTCMCWGIETGDGWFKLLDSLCFRLDDYVKHRAKVEPVIVEQVKEKFGGLRFYVHGGNEYTDGLIAMAETMSYNVCEICGNAGEPNPDGWISVRCEGCRKPKN